MAKAHGILKGDIKGNAGQLSFRQQSGVTIVSGRVYNNKSAGEGATYTQRVQRCKLANLVNVYRAIAAFEKKAWQGKGSRVSDYNMFVKKNLPSADIYLPKDWANLGAAIVDRYMVAQGSLPQITAVSIEGVTKTSLSLGDLVIGTETSIGALSEAIINNNANFKQGDKITFAILRSQYITVAGQSVPSFVPEYIECNIDINAEELVADNWKSQNGTLASSADNFLTLNGQGLGFMMVHTREKDGMLLCSTQYIVMPAVSTSDVYSTTAWLNRCAASYGYQEEVLIQPNESALVSYTYYNVNGVGGENGYVQGSTQVREGGSVTLTGVPDAGYSVKGWYDNIAGTGQALSTEDTYTVSSVSEDVTVYCLFEEIPPQMYQITALVGSDGGGTVTGGGSYAEGAEVTLTAHEDSGYQFQGWNNGSTSNPLVFTATEDVRITAIFIDLSNV